MKALFFGLGSIGKRHLRNLNKLCPEVECYALRSTKEYPEVSEVEGISVRNLFENEEVFSLCPDIAIIANPSSLHIDSCLLAAQSGSHLFVEKPLSSGWENTDELLKLTEDKNLVSYIACNWRFHPSLLKLSQILEAGDLGDLFSASIEYSDYFPGWHPWEDYRDSYVAQKKLGGGALLTCMHEIDYMYWLFGAPEKVFSSGGKKSKLDVDVDDVVDALFVHKDNFAVHLHIDIVQKTKQRSVKIQAERGTCVCDLIENTITLKDGDSETVLFSMPEYDLNEMYLAEMDYFLKRISEKDTRDINSLSEACEVMKIITTIQNQIGSNE
jgi:predicted dehydrogenase